MLFFGVCSDERTINDRDCASCCMKTMIGAQQVQPGCCLARVFSSQARSRRVCIIRLRHTSSEREPATQRDGAGRAFRCHLPTTTRGSTSGYSGQRALQQLSLKSRNREFGTIPIARHSQPLEVRQYQRYVFSSSEGRSVLRSCRITQAQ